MKKIAIFASGSGTNAQNLIQYFKKTTEISVTLVVTNNPKAKVIERAINEGVAVKLFSNKEFVDGKPVLNILRENKIDFLVLAGFLKLIPTEIIQAYPKRIVNIHPALLTKYGGKGMYGNSVHKAVIDNRETESGITIHFVNEKYDDGAIIHQKKCKVMPDDSPEKLAARIHKLEYSEFPVVVEKLISEI